MKLINNIFCLLVLLVAVSACNKDLVSESPLEEYIAISSITIDETKNSVNAENIVIKKNSELKLNCVILPDAVSDNTLLWKSSDESVATVSIDGVVKTKDKLGAAVISVTPAIGFGALEAMTSVRVQVVDSYVDISDFNLSAEGDKNEIYVSETLQLTATVTNMEATFKRFKWESSNEAVATVDENGLVTALSGGSVTITTTTDDFSANPISKTYDITVKPSILFTELTLTNEDALQALGYGQYYQIKYTFEPDDATTSLIKWESSNPDVISVDSKGGLQVKTITEGFATITAKTTKEDGTELKSTVNVEVAKGRFDCFFGNGLTPWYRESSNPGVSESSDGEKTTIEMAFKDPKYRADLQFVKDKDSYLDASKYPILAMKIKLPTYNTSGGGAVGNIIFELLQKNPDGLGGNYKGSANTHQFLGSKPSDGEIAYIYYDLLAGKFGSNFTLSTTEPTRIDRLTFKIADFKNIAPNTSYDIYWIKSFSDVEELQDYVDGELGNN